MFNSKRLVLARTRRRLTAKGLADLTDLSAMTITRLEKGENRPDPSTVERIAKAVGYPAAFFYGDDPEELNIAAVSFRSLTKMSAKERDAALSAGALGLQLSDWVERRFSLPSSNLIDLSYETDVEAAARSLRQHWGLGEKPVGNVIGLLEAQGVRVFRCRRTPGL
ncbi:helix-turn-helix domain-containing protein [Rhizobium sp. G21]|uniref:helix-turn-helix domain-containing protein n=1 Tax=Rhizobium sp. G21 TaxID=2758439 RepID=UPI001FED4511|nr:helix-turn-helix transcriptional regulator [Rhizobium sp. G21]